MDQNPPGDTLMPRYRRTLAAPPAAEDTFAFVARFENAARWDPRVHGADRVPPGVDTAVGTRFTLVTRALGREWDLPYEVTACEPPHRLVLEGRRLVVGYRDELTVRPTPGDGAASTLTYDAELWLCGPLRLVQWLMAPLLHRLFRRVGDDAVAGLGRELAAEARRLSRPAPPPLPGGRPFTDGAPTAAEVRAIVALDDRPVLRNLLITDAYHRLAVALDRRLGPGDLNWCAYATWASKSAGAFVREEELDREVRRLLEGRARLRRRLRAFERAVAALWNGDAERPEAGNGEPGEDDLGPVLRATREVSRFIVGGNLAVFAELGELFAAFLETFGDAAEPDPEGLERFLCRLTPGPARPDRVEVTADGKLARHAEGGQDLLRTAFAATHRALFESDPRRRAEWVLWANALAGLHEQTRLQGYIAGGLEAPVGELFLRRERKRLREGLPPGLRGAAEGISRRFVEPLGDEIEAAVREAVTKMVMTQRVPGEVLALGTDLPAPPGCPLYPPHLEKLEHPELMEVLGRYGAYRGERRNGGRGGQGARRLPSLGRRLRAWLAGIRGRVVAPGSAARDWGDLDERMRYIFCYFRSRQGHRRLLEPPFAPDQVAELRAGRVPPGPL
jgi:hypothetical protein